MRKTTTAMFLASATLLATAFLAPSVSRADAGGCKASAMTGQSHVDPATGAYNGSGTLTVHGKTEAIQWVSVILSATASADGTLTLTGSHRITSNNGNIDFVTLDVVTAIPTSVAGQYTFSSHLILQSGHGRIKSGFLDVTGRVDLFAGDVVLDGSSGTLCAKP